MWQPSQLPALSSTLKARGLALDPNTLTNLTSYPMDAIVSLGGCTASFVSPDGLIVTNHHCAYGALQYNSTPQQNRIDDGFLAHTFDEELRAEPTQRVYVTEQISDVTPRINEAVKPGMDAYARYVAIDQARKSIVQGCEQPGYRCDVYTFGGGYRYQLVKQREIQDVRLVYAPPRSIGKFGGDIDNWVWPRHTGDFSFLRAYVAKDGSAAPYAKDNVPYRPTHWLTLNPKGVEAGDFVMVAGYPGHTDRYRLASELQNAIDWYYPTMIALLTDELGMIEAAGQSNPDVAVKYAATVASYKNALKNFQGNLDGLAHSRALETKRTQEAALDKWLSHQSMSDGGKVNGAALATGVQRLRKLVDDQTLLRERDLVVSQLARGGMFHAAYQIVRLAQEKQKSNLDREDGYQQRDEVRILNAQQRLERQMDPALDRQLVVYVLERYLKLPADQRLPALDTWLAGANDAAALERRVAALYAGSKLADTATRVKWLDATDEQVRASDDAWLKLMVALMPDLLALERHDKTVAGEFASLRPRYMAAVTAFASAQGKPVYFDANGSLRVTFGTVQGYARHDDDVGEAPFTTAEGIVRKNTGTAPFDAPPAELKAIEDKAYDGYASPTLGTLPVNFLADLDITGGNSGSPVLDKDGHLVGLAFDGVWEGVSSGWVFDPERTRSIQVDVRYMLWVMHRLDHADTLLKEMSVPAEP
ncbi:S46 family peptidase [Pararobbsia silviterrae]|uniref:Dipeptidyl-peptidase n=2 Tax=Pararobbsia silviterrae TaxID=1792498 RepID=A0A494X6D1_9BURK|nr:S46 family peptidase [Pararobbsia silviterrae]